MYEAITRMPTVVWAPERFTGGRQVDALCQLMDFGPTILELADVPVPATRQAESLLPALRGDAWTGRSHVFVKQARDDILTETA